MYFNRRKTTNKCLNQISPPYLHYMFKIKELHYGLRNDSIIALPRYNFIKYVKYSIYIYIYMKEQRMYALDKTFVHAQSLADFKKLLRNPLRMVLHAHVWYVNLVV